LATTEYKPAAEWQPEIDRDREPTRQFPPWQEVPSPGQRVLATAKRHPVASAVAGLVGLVFDAPILVAIARQPKSSAKTPAPLPVPEALVIKVTALALWEAFAKNQAKGTWSTLANWLKGRQRPRPQNRQTAKGVRGV
jgi:hypothetical protein